MSESEFYVETYTNHLKQIIQPGDDVVMVTTGYGHSVSIRRGKFLGVRKNSKGDIVGQTCEYVATRMLYNYNLPVSERYKCENTQVKDVTTKTTLKLGRVYKLDTKAWKMSV